MKYLLTIVIGLFTLGTQAQPANYPGVWILKEQKPDSGQFYSNGVPKQIIVTQSGKELRMEKITACDGPDVTAVETPGTEDHPFEMTTASKRKKLINMQWDADGKGFTVIAHLYSAADNSKLEITITDVFSMVGGQLYLGRPFQR